MFVAELLTTLTKGLSGTFNLNYPVSDFRDLKVSIEYPIAATDYPSVWVGFEPTGQLETVGIGHEEYEDGTLRPYKRWRFSGYATYTIATLSSLERARLTDEVIKIFAFGDEDTQRGHFRSHIEGNDLIAVNFDFDQIGLQGAAETPGTPWDTDEIIYEVTLRMECVGEFVSDGPTSTLVALSAVEFLPYRDDEEDPRPNWE